MKISENQLKNCKVGILVTISKLLAAQKAAKLDIKGRKYPICIILHPEDPLEESREIFVCDTEEFISLISEHLK